MNKFLILIAPLLIQFASIKGQVNSVSQLDSKNINWFNTDYSAKKTIGASVDKAYTDLLSKKKQKKTIVVAIIDSGTDIYHEDLSDNIWVNEKEIPNNKIDDDGNGYVDDINGWSFLGNSSGTNIEYENYEFVRIVRTGDKTNPDYAWAKKMYDKKWKEQKDDAKTIAIIDTNIKVCKYIIAEGTGVHIKTKRDLDRVKPNNQYVVNAKKYLTNLYKSGLTDEVLQEWGNENKTYTSYYLNLDYDARKIIGDNPLDITDKNYGNPDVKGPGSTHGTFVAGIVAATRDNSKGINGIASTAKIMALRAVPDGDERDKDIALAIRYAVDNGAQIINMSFGKSFSPQKQFVDSAIKYAEKNNVLIVHAAGNDSQNIDEEKNFPSTKYNDGNTATNMITVGASDKLRKKNLVATFSNYGKENVDLFAPGVDIVSLDTNNLYNTLNGTSFAAPVVSGVAALLLSYYPELTPQEVIDILKTSSYKVTKPKKVLLPPASNKKKVKFQELSKSGGIINAYNALLEAEKRSGLKN